jgi:L-asparagine transporter-like permease
MEEAARTLSALSEWESFYVIVGSSGAALTGLQFVVMALIAESSRRSTGREISAFGTPTVIHFCAVLLISAIVSAPWHALSSVAYALGACGFAGLTYMLIVIRRARQQTGYRPVFEDWLWHVVLPLVAYALVLIVASLLTSHSARLLFLVALAALLLLFIGIHNAWDTITYFAISEPQALKESGDQEKDKTGDAG